MTPSSIIPSLTSSANKTSSSTSRSLIWSCSKVRQALTSRVSRLPCGRLSNLIRTTWRNVLLLKRRMNWSRRLRRSRIPTRKNALCHLMWRQCCITLTTSQQRTNARRPSIIWCMTCLFSWMTSSSQSISTRNRKMISPLWWWEGINTVSQANWITWWMDKRRSTGQEAVICAIRNRRLRSCRRGQGDLKLSLNCSRIWWEVVPINYLPMVAVPQIVKFIELI